MDLNRRVEKLEQLAAEPPRWRLLIDRRDGVGPCQRDGTPVEPRDTDGWTFSLDIGPPPR